MCESLGISKNIEEKLFISKYAKLFEEISGEYSNNYIDLDNFKAFFEACLTFKRKITDDKIPSETKKTNNLLSKNDMDILKEIFTHLDKYSQDIVSREKLL